MFCHRLESDESLWVAFTRPYTESRLTDCFSVDQHGALSHSPLLSTLYTTGFIYFFLILSIAISNITVWFAGGPSLKRLLNIIFRAAMSVGGSRIILELRGVKVGFGSDDLAGIENEDDSRGRSIGLSKFRAGDRIEDVRDNGEYGMDPHEAGVDGHLAAPATVSHSRRLWRELGPFTEEW